MTQVLIDREVLASGIAALSELADEVKQLRDCDHAPYQLLIPKLRAALEAKPVEPVYQVLEIFGTSAVWVDVDADAYAFAGSLPSRTRRVLYTAPPEHAPQVPLADTGGESTAQSSAVACQDPETANVQRIAAGYEQRIAELEQENAKLRTVPMKYRRMEFNAQLQKENAELDAQLTAANEARQKAEKVAEICLFERDAAKAGYERAIQILLGIHALLYPPRVTDSDGRTWQFKSPIVEEQMQALSDRIRALPDEIAAIAQGKEPT